MFSIIPLCLFTVALNLWMASTAAVQTFNIGVNLPYGSTITGSIARRIGDLIRVMDTQTTLLRSIDSNYAFNLSYTDTASSGNVTRSLTVAAHLASIEDLGVHAIAGDYISRMTIPTALAIGQRYRMWLCSGSSTSMEMSDKVDFPRTFRTIPDDPQLGFALAAFVSNQGWKNVATLACSDAYGLSLYNSFVQGAARFGINIRITQTFNLGATQATNQLRVIKESGWRVIIYMGQSYEGKYLLAEARDTGLIGDDYVWVTGDGLASIFIGNQPRGLETIQKATNGLMLVFPADKENANTLQLKTKWSAAYPDVAIPPYGFIESMKLTWIRAQLAYKFGHANVTAGQHNGTLSDFLLPFEGVSGSPVAFHPTTGDRLGEYTILYGQDGAFIPALSILPNYSQIETRPLLFHSGTTRVPFDRAQPGPALYRWEDSQSGSVVAIVVIMASAMLLTCAYIAAHRHEQAVRHLSFAFLMLISIGCLCIVFSPLLNLGMATPELCAGNVSMLLTGVHLILACSAVKAYRIYFIFENAMLGKTKRITDKYLLMSVSVLMAIHFTILALFLAFTPIQVREVPGSDPYLRCMPVLSSQSSALSITTSVLIFAYLGFLSVCVLALAYRTRKVSQQWGESIWLFYAMQTVVLATTILIPFYALEFGNRSTTAWLQLVITVYASCFAFYSLVGRVAVLVFIQRSNAKLEAVVMGGSTTLGGAAAQAQRILLERRNEAGGGSSSGRGLSGGGQRSGLSTDGSVTGAMVVESTKLDGLHLAGQFPIKREDVLLSTWKVQEMSVCFRQGLLNILPVADNAHDSSRKPIITVRLSMGMLEAPIQGLPLCARLKPANSFQSWLVQFGTEAELESWTSCFSHRESRESVKRELKAAGEALGAAQKLMRTVSTKSGQV